MKPLTKAESKHIKRKLNAILENFNTFTRHQLSRKLIQIGKYCNPPIKRACTKCGTHLAYNAPKGRCLCGSDINIKELASHVHIKNYTNPRDGA